MSSVVHAARALAAAALTIALASRAAPAQSGAFLVTLGKDTIALERYTRTGNTITGEEVVRIPVTTMRNYTLTLGANGMPAHLEFTNRRLTAPGPVTRVSADFGADTVRGTVTTDSTRAIVVAAHGAIPFANLQFAFQELALQLARASGRDSLQYPLWQVGGRTLLTGTVKRLGTDSMTLALNDQPAYRARLDRAGQMTGLQGLATTQKYEVARLATADVQGFAAASARRDSSGQALGMLSPPDTVRGTIGGAHLQIAYSKPAKRGRTVFGGMVPWDQVWRTGANAATDFTTDAEILINNVPVPAGRYSLWTLPSQNGWKLIINRQKGQWGTVYFADSDLVRIDMTRATLSQPLERFAITLQPAGDAGILSFLWDNTVVSVPVAVRK